MGQHRISPERDRVKFLGMVSTQRNLGVYCAPGISNRKSEFSEHM